VSAPDNTTGRMAVPLSPQDISRIFRRTHGGSLNTSDWEFADQLQRDCLLRMGVSTVRDDLAAKAMQAMVQGHFSHYGHEQYWPRDQIASEAYGMADAMLIERAKATGAAA